MTGLYRKIDRFWNARVDDRVYGCLRLGFAFVSFLNLWSWWTVSDELLSSAGFNSMRSAAEASSWAGLSLFAFVRDPVLIQVILAALAVVYVLLFFGVASRWCLLVSFYWQFSYMNWAALGTGGWDTVLGNLCFVLVLSPTGRSVRPGAWLRSLFSKGRPPGSPKSEIPMSPGYGVFLLRIEVFVIYWVAVVTRFPDPYWLNGDFFGYYLLSDFCWFGGPWVLEADWLVKSATWGTQIAEILIPLLLVYRRTWKIGFALGAALHLALAITTTHLILFSLSMMVIYLSFVRFPERDGNALES